MIALWTNCVPTGVVCLSEDGAFSMFACVVDGGVL